MTFLWLVWHNARTGMPRSVNSEVRAAQEEEAVEVQEADVLLAGVVLRYYQTESDRWTSPCGKAIV
jgi:hypothetical protein